MQFETVLEDFNEISPEQRGLESLLSANENLKLLQNGTEFSENELRSLQQELLQAFWVFDKLRESLSHNIHEIGRLLDDSYGCKISFDEEKQQYYTMCPAILLHNDFGFSRRAVEKYKCSICGKPIARCEHITGDFYDGVVCWTDDYECCNICGRKSCTDHIVRKKYNHVKAGKILFDFRLITYDVVQNPDNKFARMTKLYFEKEDVLNGFVDETVSKFIYGESELLCHHCTNCEGYKPDRFAELFDRAKRTGYDTP